jgi:hypothetical protein
MQMGPVRIVTGGGRREGTAAIPRAARRGRAGMSVLAAAAGLAILTGTITGTTAARAAAPASAHATATAQPGPRFEPCPCDNPICRPVC